MMINRYAVILAFGLSLCAVAKAQDADASSQSQEQGPGGPGQRGGRGGMMGPMMGRGVLGTVTEVASDHYTVKNESGETYTIHFSANTRIMKSAPRQQGQQQGGERTPPQAIKPSDIKVGDVIGANGEIDTAAKSVGAIFIMQIDPERAKQMREMQANYLKTWMMGKVTVVNETKVTLQGGPDNAEHSFVADENTSFRKRRDPITLADLQPGDNVRVEGAMKDGVFIATAVTVMGPRPAGGPAPSQKPPQ